jgi:hypothetical protein
VIFKYLQTVAHIQIEPRHVNQNLDEEVGVAG